MMDLTKLSKEVHQAAVDRGWWAEEHSVNEVIALCHLKLSEALKAYQEGQPLEWYACGIESAACVGECGFCTNGKCPYKYEKPEGIAVELCNCILRILDWFGYCGTDVQTLCDNAKLQSEAEFKSFIDFLSVQHAKLSLALIRDLIDDEPKRDYNMAVCINQISDWLSQNYGENWHEVLLRKHEYNKSRPYRMEG